MPFFLLWVSKFDFDSRKKDKHGIYYGFWLCTLMLLAMHPHAFGFGDGFSGLNSMQITSDWIGQFMVCRGLPLG